MIKREGVDKAFLATLGILILFGIVMIYDATVVFAQGTFGEAYRFVILHLIWITLGLVCFYLLSRFDYHKIEKYIYPIFFITLIPLVVLSFLGFIRQVGLVACNSQHLLFPCINGASRWLYLNLPVLKNIPFLSSIGYQPSELAKLSLIMYLAVALDRILNQKGKVVANVATAKHALVVTLVSTGLVSFLVFMQPNLSTAILIFIIGLCIYFSSGAPIKPLLAVLPVLVASGAIFILSSSYRRARLLTLINGTTGGADLDLGYHIQQISIALGSGGFFGLGFGQSRQKFQYLPEVAADSIFAIVGEELGWLGTTIVILLFLFLVYKGMSIAKEAPDTLGKLLAVGITTWIGFQVFVNIAAMIRLIPLTGVPLPLISYGGSSTIFLLMGLGILANISRQGKW